jgi:hypothetical protein
LSVRQPYAAQIIEGLKKIEYRSQPTTFPKYVYIYASKTTTPREKKALNKLGKEPGELPTGVLVGTVEIIDCTGGAGDYKWHLANPKKLKKAIKPENHPNPVWFKPFKEEKAQ